MSPPSLPLNILPTPLQEISLSYFIWVIWSPPTMFPHLNFFHTQVLPQVLPNFTVLSLFLSQCSKGFLDISQLWLFCDFHSMVVSLLARTLRWRKISLCCPYSHPKGPLIEKTKWIYLPGFRKLSWGLGLQVNGRALNRNTEFAM
jgi:hypothetical protein